MLQFEACSYLSFSVTNRERLVIFIFKFVGAAVRIGYVYPPVSVANGGGTFTCSTDAFISINFGNGK